MKYKQNLLWLLLFSCSAVYAENNSAISNIVVVGNERIESATVLSYVDLKTPDTLTLDNSDTIINRLYKTGFFSNIALFRDKSKLIIQVQENPTISDVNVTGDKAFDHDLMLKALKNSGVDTIIWDFTLLLLSLRLQCFLEIGCR